MDDEILLALAFDLAAGAGETILAVRARGFDTFRKADASPVTEADRESERLILSGLRAATPDIPVVAEEEIAAGKVPARGGCFWCVDPLDGTREFTAGGDDFAVCIGLVRDGRAVLGVVGAPVERVLYGGIVGRGAKRRSAGAERPIAARRPPPEGVTVFSSRRHGDDARATRFLARWQVAGQVRLGSALKFCRLAEGLGDLYPRFGTTMEWDTCASQAVLEAAGGHVLVIESGAPLGYGKPGWVNPHFYATGSGVTGILRPDEAGIARAAALLRSGGLVAFVTETVYGLGADATDARAVAAIFAAKDRPRFNPLICHYPTAAAAFADAAATPLAERLAAAFWPGPLTLVLPRRASSAVADLVGAGGETLALRVPGHPHALALLRATGRPVAAPSANRSGQVSPTTAEHVLAGLAGRIDAVLDSGACPVGVELTVLDLAGGRPRLLRPGGTTREAIEAVIGPIGAVPPPVDPTRPLRSPGQMSSHYAPALPVRLRAAAAAPDEALLAFGPAPAGAGAMFQLSERRDLAEAAARLFAGLRELDAAGARLGLRRIAVMVVPEEGLGLAINDRLRRAAAPR